MSLKHTLLGLLILHPRTGYDLYKRLEQAAFLLKSASLRRIYPTLKRLTEEGLAVYEVEPQEGKPDRKIYQVTDAGEAEFLAWLGEPPERDGHDLMALFPKLFFYGLLDKAALLAGLNEALAARQEALKALQQVKIAPPVGPCREIVDSERVTAVWNMMLDYGQRAAETQMRWLQDAIGKVEQEF